jgi:hypothetical protein
MLINSDNNNDNDIIIIDIINHIKLTDPAIELEDINNDNKDPANNKHETINIIIQNIVLMVFIFFSC